MSAPTCLRALPAAVVTALDVLVGEGAAFTLGVQGQDRALVIVPREYMDARGRRRALSTETECVLVAAGFVLAPPGDAAWRFVTEPGSRS